MFFPHDFSSIREFAAAWPMVLFDASIKGLLLLAAAGLLLRTLKNMPAAGRHLICVLTMAGFIALPLLSVALPAWRVPIFSTPSAIGVIDLRGNRDHAPTFSQGSTNKTRVRDSRANDETNRTASPIPQNGFSKTSFRPHSADTWSRWICAVWLLGTGLVLAPLAGGMFTVHRLIRSGHSLETDQSIEIIRDIARQLGLRRQVRLIASEAVQMPMTAGVLRPTILLPAHDDWQPGRLRLVLTHELAHVARWDCLTDRLMQLGCALHWFHPLVWLLARAAHLERERACDDLVLSLGARPSDYADVLLFFARSKTRGMLPRAALGITSSLERRLAMILDSTTKRRPLRRQAVLAGGVILMLVVVPLAVLRPAARAGDAPERPSEASDTKQAGENIQPASKRTGEGDDTSDRKTALRDLQFYRTAASLNRLLALNNDTTSHIEKLGHPTNSAGIKDVAIIKSAGVSYVAVAARRYPPEVQYPHGEHGIGIGFLFDREGNLKARFGGNLGPDDLNGDKVHFTTLGTADRWFVRVYRFEKNDRYSQRCDVFLVEPTFPLAFRVWSNDGVAWTTEPYTSRDDFEFSHFLIPGDLDPGVKGEGADGQPYYLTIGWDAKKKLFRGPSQITHDDVEIYTVDLDSSKRFIPTDRQHTK